MVKFHSFFPTEKWPLESEQQVQRETDIVSNRHDLQNHIHHEIELAEESVVHPFLIVKHKDVEDIGNFDEFLESVYVYGYQDDIVVGKGL